MVPSHMSVIIRSVKKSEVLSELSEKKFCVQLFMSAMWEADQASQPSNLEWRPSERK